jgi:biopolymer transport protein ExbD
MPGYGYIRERKADEGLSARPQIIPFADVVLVLLVIFLVSTSASVQMVDVNLPDAEHVVSRDITLAVTISITDKAPPVRADATRPAVAVPVPAGEPARPAEGDTAAEKEKKPVDPWRFYFEDDSTGVEAKNLWTALKAIKGANAWALALIRADKNTPCEHVAILIQCLQGLGVDEIAFFMKTEEKK